MWTHGLQVDDDSTEDEIKAAYRQLAKVCHPDFAGDAGHNICILLNEVSRRIAVPIAVPRTTSLALRTAPTRLESRKL